MIAAAMERFSAKWNATTPRERAGLAVLAALGALTAAIYAMEWASTRAGEAASASRTAAQGQAMLTALEDDAYRQHLAREAGFAWNWSQTDDAFAAESVRAEIDAIALQAGFPDPTVTLVEQTATQGQVSTVQASISADFEWANFFALLEALEANDLNVAVRSIDVSESEGAQRMTLVVAVPVINESEAR